MGSSREVAVAALAEPALLLALFAVAWRSGGTDLSSASGFFVAQGVAAVAPSQLLALAAMVIVVIAETGRVPADNPDTHLELTMIHEGMLLEYSGRPLGILLWASLLKQIVLFSLVAALFFPFGIAAAPSEIPAALGGFALKLIVLARLMSLVESSSASQSELCPSWMANAVRSASMSAARSSGVSSPTWAAFMRRRSIGSARPASA